VWAVGPTGPHHVPEPLIGSDVGLHQFTWVEAVEVVSLQADGPLWIRRHVNAGWLQGHSSHVPQRDLALVTIIHSLEVAGLHLFFEPFLILRVSEQVIWQADVTHPFAIHQVAVDFVGRDAALVQGSRGPVARVINAVGDLDIADAEVAVDVVEPLDEPFCPAHDVPVCCCACGLDLMVSLC
jgi:hypothetical protein